MQVTAVLNHADRGGFIDFNPETGTTTPGETLEDALATLREGWNCILRSFR